MNLALNSTMNRYLAVRYVRNFLYLIFGLLLVIYLFDTVELLRRANKFDNVPLSLVLQMGLLKLPEVGQVSFPFAILFSAMLTFWQLTQRYELVVIRAAGLSVWQFLAPVILSALAIGIIQVTIINPFGAMLLSRFETLEGQHLNLQKNLVTLSRQGLWLLQSDENNQVVLHSARIKMPEWKLQDVIVLFFDENDTFQRRIDAQEAILERGQWSFFNVYSNAPGDLPQQSDFITLATDITIEEIEDSFASPETIPFWKLLAFIETMESTGFDATSLKIHFQSLLAKPLLFASMILLAASVSLRPPRFRGTSTLIIVGIFMGFIVFFLSSFLHALGASGQIPIILAAWAPALIAFLFGLTAILNTEDG